MNTKLTRIKYHLWNGDPVAAKLAFENEKIGVDFANGDLILKAGDDKSKYIHVSRGLFVVGVPDPRNMGYIYYRMSKPQLKQYLELGNRGESIALV